jgi:hypothetical protein
LQYIDEHLLPAFGNRPINQVTRGELDQWLAAKSRQADFPRQQLSESAASSAICLSLPVDGMCLALNPIPFHALAMYAAD